MVAHIGTVTHRRYRGPSLSVCTTLDLDYTPDGEVSSEAIELHQRLIALLGLSEHPNVGEGMIAKGANIEIHRGSEDRFAAVTVPVTLMLTLEQVAELMEGVE